VGRLQWVVHAAAVMLALGIVDFLAMADEEVIQVPGGDAAAARRRREGGRVGTAAVWAIAALIGWAVTEALFASLVQPGALGLVVSAVVSALVGAGAAWLRPLRRPAESR
jgi:hypothetical protein